MARSKLQHRILLHFDLTEKLIIKRVGSRAGGSGIPSLHVHDPLSSARGQELAPNGRFMFPCLRFGGSGSRGKR
ncbi:hypothetical protein H5410_030766 [Solanum commersonii]|uniref:Uncharacterized protein n=1 Tax=Solanum commersonii TaxID=4109 RepID=A0A9J5YJN9_SOLCO|nr:hypothetical protein H5410_030766 [Solanum commersonii]